MEAKTPAMSEVYMSELVLPNDTNLLGNLLHPIHLGEIVQLKAKLTWVGKTSMEVKVVVYEEKQEYLEAEKKTGEKNIKIKTESSDLNLRRSDA